jgi:hypothetical protein
VKILKVLLAGFMVLNSDTVLYTKLNQESAVGDWRKDQILKIIYGYKPKNISDTNENGLCMLPPNRAVNLKGDSYNGGKNSEEKVMVQ